VLETRIFLCRDETITRCNITGPPRAVSGKLRCALAGVLQTTTDDDRRQRTLLVWSLYSKRTNNYYYAYDYFWVQHPLIDSTGVHHRQRETAEQVGFSGYSVRKWVMVSGPLQISHNPPGDALRPLLFTATCLCVRLLRNVKLWRSDGLWLCSS